MPLLPAFMPRPRDLVFARVFLLEPLDWFPTLSDLGPRSSTLVQVSSSAPRVFRAIVHRGQDKFSSSLFCTSSLRHHVYPGAPAESPQISIPAQTSPLGVLHEPPKQDGHSELTFSCVSPLCLSVSPTQSSRQEPSIMRICFIFFPLLNQNLLPGCTAQGF